MNEEISIKLDSYSDQIVNSLYQLQQKGVNCDVKLEAQDGSVPLHGIIMVATSIAHVQESSKTSAYINRVIDCSKYSVYVVNAVVKYLYTGEIRIRRKFIEELKQLVLELNLQSSQCMQKTKPASISLCDSKLSTAQTDTYCNKPNQEAENSKRIIQRTETNLNSNPHNEEKFNCSKQNLKSEEIGKNKTCTLKAGNCNKQDKQKEDTLSTLRKTEEDNELKIPKKDTGKLGIKEEVFDPEFDKNRKDDNKVFPHSLYSVKSGIRLNLPSNRSSHSMTSEENEDTILTSGGGYVDNNKSKLSSNHRDKFEGHVYYDKSVGEPSVLKPLRNTSTENEFQKSPNFSGNKKKLVKEDTYEDDVFDPSNLEPDVQTRNLLLGEKKTLQRLEGTSSVTVQCSSDDGYTYINDANNSVNSTKSCDNTSEQRLTGLHKDIEAKKNISNSNSELSTKSEAEEKPKQCDECNLSFDQSIKYTKHMIDIHHQFSCNKCEWVCYQQGIHAAHMWTQHNTIAYPQIYPPLRTEAMSEHENKAESLDKSPLEIYNKNRQEENQSSFICEICNKNYKSKDAWKRHKKLHGPHFTCKTCTRTFQSYACLEEHNKMKHSSKESSLCSTCEKSFPTKESLNSHTCTKRHPENLLACPYEECGKSFVREQTLADHIHTHVKLHTCDTCNKSFNRAACSKHVTCEECRKSTKSVFYNQKSEQQSTWFVCKCGKQFRWRTNLSRHKRTCDSFKQ